MRLFIIPGWSEGAWQTRQFAKHLPKEWQLTTDIYAADVVVTHSAGGYLVPEDIEPKLLLIIAPPHHREISMAKRIFYNIVADIPKQIKQWGLRYLLTARTHNTLYILLYPTRHIKIWRSVRQMLKIANRANKTIVIRNTGDRFCTPKMGQYVKQFKNVHYKEMPGLHEDCWFDSRPYIELIKQYLA